MMTSFQADRRSLAAFTMLELLSVIAIILILAGLILPVLSRVHTHAFEVAAKVEVKQIETAWNQYFAEYQTWPACFEDDSSYAVRDNVLRILEGNGTNYNPKSISFMHFTRYNSVSNPISPWGSRTAASSTNYYYCRFDMNYDETILTDTVPPVSVRRSVIVWTMSPDNDVIGSWQE